MKKLIVGLLIAFMLSVSISDVFADRRGGGDHDDHGGDHGDSGMSGGGRRRIVPEPMGYLLIAAGGATLASIRHWRAKRRHKNSSEVLHDSE